MLKALLFIFLLAPLGRGPFESNIDVGASPQRGSVEYDMTTGKYRVSGGGANIGGEQDAFQFVYKKVSGDVTLTADVQFLNKSTEVHRKLALMVRQSLAPDSAYADVALGGDGFTAFQYRPSAGVDASEFRAAMKSPTHLSITRHNNEFSISASDVGVSPATVGPIIVSMRDPVYVGLAVCSHNTDVLETAVFSHVKLTTK